MNGSCNCLITRLSENRAMFTPIRFQEMIKVMFIEEIDGGRLNLRFENTLSFFMSTTADIMMALISS